MASRAEELATAHAGYIRSVLEVSGVPESTIDQCMFHYKTAFVHGYKHGVEDSETGNTVISKDCLDMGHPRNGSVFNDGPGYPSSFTGKAGAILANIERELGIGEDRYNNGG